MCFYDILFLVVLHTSCHAPTLMNVYCVIWCHIILRHVTQHSMQCGPTSHTAGHRVGQSHCRRGQRHVHEAAISISALQVYPHRGTAFEVFTVLFYQCVSTIFFRAVLHDSSLLTYTCAHAPMDPPNMCTDLRHNRTTRVPKGLKWGGVWGVVGSYRHEGLQGLIVGCGWFRGFLVSKVCPQSTQTWRRLMDALLAAKEVGPVTAAESDLTALDGSWKPASCKSCSKKQARTAQNQLRGLPATGACL